MENSKGERKLIVPYGKIKSESLGCFNTRFTIEPAYDKPSIAFSLDSSSKPYGVQKEQQLYMANLLFAQKNYSQALALLRSSHSHIIPFSNQEKLLLEQMLNIAFEGNDQSPHATAVVLASLALLHSVPIRSFAEDELASKELFEKQKFIYFRYHEFVNQRSLVPHLHITRQEEEDALKCLIDLSDTEFFFLSYYFQGLLENLDNHKNQLITPKLSVETKSRFSFIGFQAGLQEKIMPEEQLLITRPLKLDFWEWFDLAHVDPLKLELYLVGAQSIKTIPQEIITFLRSVSHGFAIDKATLEKMISEKNEEGFVQILKEAAQFEKSWQSKDSENVESIGGQAPLKHPQNPASQKISIRSDDASHLISVPIPPRKMFLSDEQLQASFIEVENRGVQLTPEEIKELQKAVCEGGNSELPSDSQELAENIETYWSSEQHQKPWHRVQLRTTLPAANDTSKPLEVETKILLLVEHTELGKKVQLLEQELLDFANQGPQELQAFLLQETEKIGHLRSEITLNDLILFTARSRHFTLAKKNPELLERERELLHKCLIFFDTKAAHQQLGRALTALNDMEKEDVDSPPYDRLSETCYRELTRVPLYNAHENPELLIFEMLENMGLYDWQVKDLARMLSNLSGENRNIILEKMMGSGKTRIYLLLWALSKADGDHIPFVVVHSSQYDTVGKAMQINSGQKFAQLAHPLVFTRESDTSVSGLQEILDKLKKVRSEKHFFVVTDKSMHSLNLAYDELFASYLISAGTDPDLKERYELMQKIMDLIKGKGKAVLDEADLLLHCRHEMVYSIGESEPIKPAHVSIVVDLFRSIDSYLKSLQPFTIQSYQQLKPQLIEAFVKEVVANKFPHLDQELVNKYLHENKAGEHYVAGLDATERDQLAIAFHQFKELLPIVLDRRAGEHYGYSHNPEKLLAVPYLASGVPSPTSDFSFPYARSIIRCSHFILRGYQPACWKVLFITCNTVPKKSLNQILA